MGGYAPANSMLQSVRKAIRKQGSYIARSGDTRQHHQAILKSLYLAEAMLQAGFNLDTVTEAIKAANGGGCNRAPVCADQAKDEDAFHATELTDRSLEADGILLHELTKPGREENV